MAFKKYKRGDARESGVIRYTYSYFTVIWEKEVNVNHTKIFWISGVPTLEKNKFSKQCLKKFDFLNEIKG